MNLFGALCRIKKYSERLSILARLLMRWRSLLEYTQTIEVVYLSRRLIKIYRFIFVLETIFYGNM